MSVTMATTGGAVDVSPPKHAAPSVVKESLGHTMYDPTISFQGKEVFRSGTPDTYLPEFPTNPDISIQCKKCGMFVQLFKLKDHRYYHSALSLLKYKGNNRPETSSSLFRRRNAILKKLKSMATSEKPLDPQHIKRINEAYEYLKAELDGSLEEFRTMRDDIDTDVHGMAVESSCSCIFAVGFCSTANDRWKSHMEDTRVFQDCFGGDPTKSFLSVYDGHHGRFSAEMCANEFHGLLLNEMSKFDPQIKSIIAENTIAEGAEMSNNDLANIESYCTVSGMENNYNVDSDNTSLNVMRQIIQMCEKKYETLTRENTKISRNKSTGVTFNLEGESCPLKSPKSPVAEKMEAALKKSYHLMNIFLSYGKDECSRFRWSGCSALTAVVQSHSCENSESESCSVNGTPDADVVSNSYADDAEVQSSHRSESRRAYSPPRQLGSIHLANAGNVQAVLVRGNRAYRVSKDHTPKNPKERERILRAGGTISDSYRDGRVNGVITTTRGLGNHGDKNLKKCVIVNPYTTTIPIDQYAQILLIASSGVWDVFTVQEAAQFVSKLLPSNYIPPLTKIDSTLQSLLSGQDTMEEEKTTAKKLSFSSSDAGHDAKKNELSKSLKTPVMTEFDRSCDLETGNIESVENVHDGSPVKSESENKMSPVKSSIKSSSSPVKSEKSSSFRDTKVSEKSVIINDELEISRSSETDQLGSDSVQKSQDDKEKQEITMVSIGMTDMSSGRHNHLFDQDQRVMNSETEDKSSETFQGNIQSASTLFRTSTRRSSHSSSDDKGNLSPSKIKFQNDGTYGDMKTEVGSHVDGFDSEEDSGNEADVETNGDLSRPFSHLSEYGDISSRDQVRREVAKTMAEHLVQAALLAGAKDNITVMVALLPGCEL